VGRQETPNSAIWESALTNLSLMASAKSEVLEFFLPKSGDFSKGDAHEQHLGFSNRPTTDTSTFKLIHVSLRLQKVMHYPKAKPKL